VGLSFCCLRGLRNKTSAVKKDIVLHLTLCTQNNRVCPWHTHTLLWRFLLTEGEPGWPGLGTALEPADAEALSSVDAEEEGSCCWDTFCSSAANCLGSTPGDRGGLSPEYL